MNSAEPRLQTTEDQQQIEQKLFESVEALLPRFKERAEETRQLRKVPQASIDELQETGFFLALQPRQFGGYEMSPQGFFNTAIKISEACMSTAWASGIIAVHAFQLALMDERAQKDVWSDNIHTRVSSSYAPMGKIEVVEDGFKLSGRWGWSSGSDHCTWVLLGAIVPNDGYRTFLVPMPDYRIEDTWQAMGLQGTGSNDIVVEDAFVPAYRTHRQIDGFQLTNPGYAVSDAPLYRIPWAQIFARTVCSPAIGATRAAVELFKQGALGKASNDPTKLAQDTATQMLVANAITEIDEIEAILYRNFDRMTDAVNAGQEIPLQDRVLYRYQASLVIEKCIAAIDSLFNSAGGRSVFLGSEIQQRFLDIHTARAHVANNPTPFARNLGAMQLGMENTDFFV